MDVNRFLSDYPNGAFISTFLLHGYEFEFICFTLDDALVACKDILELMPSTADFRCFVREFRTNGDIIEHYLR